jgi:hypothetical protein
MALKQEGPRAIEEDKRQGIFTRWDPNVSMKGMPPLFDGSLPYCPEGLCGNRLPAARPPKLKGGCKVHEHGLVTGHGSLTT